MHLPLLTLNPGQYTAPAGGSYLPVLICGAIALVFFVISGLMAQAADRGQSNALTPGFVAATTIFALAFIGVFVTTYVVEKAAIEAEDNARTAYNGSVVTWFDDVYGVDVNEDSARDLIDGESLVVDYQGAETMVEIVKRSDSDLSVRIPDGALLEPLNR